jgi:hypothetical protein
MKNLKHTQGNWRIEMTSPGQNVDLNLHNKALVNPFNIVTDEAVVCIIAVDGEFPMEQTVADSRLIAAAPKMLEELFKVYTELLARMPDDWRYSLDGQNQLSSLRNIISIATNKSIQEVQNHFDSKAINI